MAGEAWTREAAREAFSVLAHDIRLAIVLALLDGWAGVHTEARSYSELMDAVGMEDSGKFNYHLSRLRGVYVEQVGERYVPTASAVALYHTVVATRPTELAEQTEFDIEMACPYCSGSVIGRYEQEYLTVECSECDDWWGLSYPFPKNGLRGRSGDDVLSALENRAMHDVGLARTGQCPACAGHTTVDIPRDRLDGERYPTVEMYCETCSWLATIDVLNALRFEPRVVAGLAELGCFLETDEQEIEDVYPDVSGRVESTDPFRAAVEVELDGGLVTLVVDDELAVRSVSIEQG